MLDTNTVISGLLWNGAPARLIDAAQDARIELASSAGLPAELQGVLSREKFARRLARRGLGAGILFDGHAALVLMVHPAEIAPTVARDPADDQTIATAVAAQADLIVSGDAHLLDLKRSHGIEIVDAAAALQRISAAPPG